MIVLCILDTFRLLDTPDRNNNINPDCISNTVATRYANQNNNPDCSRNTVATQYANRNTDPGCSSSIINDSTDTRYILFTRYADRNNNINSPSIVVVE
jgi:hypothetical protein